MPGDPLCLRVLILFALPLLFDVRTVTAGTLGALVDLALYCWPEIVLRPVLFLTCKDPLIEELCVLASVECVIANVLAVARSLSWTRCSRLAVLGAALIGVLHRHAVVMRHVVDCLELLHLIDRIIIHVIIIVADWITLIKILLSNLGNASSMFGMVCSSSIYIIDGHTIGT